MVGFAFKNDIPIERMPKPSTFHTHENREIPTVFVQMDLDIGYSVSNTLKNFIPFVAFCKKDEKHLENFHRWCDLAWTVDYEPSSRFIVHSPR